MCKSQITSSIVAYKNNTTILKKAIDSFLNTSLKVKLYLIDNSPANDLSKLAIDPRIEYIFNNKNLGFGKAHNIALEKSLTDSKYHLVLNPDIEFGGGVLEKLFDYMEGHTDIGNIMPKILYPNGDTQYLCKLLPTPADLFLRRFIKGEAAEKRNKIFELQCSGYDKIMDIPFLSGCFMFLRTSALKEIGLFDDRIFMYGEDLDLGRRLIKKFRTVFYPHAEVIHHYEKGSYKNKKLMLYNIHGVSIYFSKHGWFFDKERRKINQKTLKEVCP